MVKNQRDEDDDESHLFLPEGGKSETKSKKDKKQKDDQDEDKSSESNEESEGEEYKEQRKFCYCFSLKCGFIFLACVAIWLFIFMCLNVILIYENEYFDRVYPTLIAVFLVINLCAIVLWVVYFVAEDSRGSRALVPWAFLAYSVGSLLITLWVVIYIFGMYKREKVFVRSWEEDDGTEPDSDGKKHNYTRVSKTTYVIENIWAPLIVSVTYGFMFILAYNWEKRHRNQDKAYG